jgi:adenosylmethionine---8-amino-7-oxononanoate aminotransferase
MTIPLITRDLRYIWHPCSQMHDYKKFPPIIIKKAYGSYLELENGQKIIDAISSWWCKSLGHNHPRLRSALLKQTEKFEHIIGANTCNETLVELSEKLAKLAKGLSKVFYASEGSSAVEIALKMSIHFRKLSGENSRNKIMALKNGYHGETILALAVSDLNLYKEPYTKFLPKVTILQNIPYVATKNCSRWHDCTTSWSTIENELNKRSNQLTAIIVEPIIQGSGGMLLYSQDFLKRLRIWTKKNNVHLIADEIMTGFGRTGFDLACKHANIEPDFLCLSKGLTSGWLAMSAMLTTNDIYNMFYAAYNKNKSFLHSHTFSGNALAAAIALETQKIIAEENIYSKVQLNETLFLNLMTEVANKTHRITNIRGIGAIIAADLVLDKKQQNKRLGFQVFRHAIKLGAFLRPLGNTIYWLPPLNTKINVLHLLKEITIAAIKTTFND